MCRSCGRLAWQRRRSRVCVRGLMSLQLERVDWHRCCCVAYGRSAGLHARCGYCQQHLQRVVQGCTDADTTAGDQPYVDRQSAAATHDSRLGSHYCADFAGLTAVPCWLVDERGEAVAGTTSSRSSVVLTGLRDCGRSLRCSRLCSGSHLQRCGLYFTDACPRALLTTLSVLLSASHRHHTNCSAAHSIQSD